MLSNQKCMIQPTLINLHSNEYSQEFYDYLFSVKLDSCVGSCNTLNNLSNKVCAPNKTEDLNLSVFNMITSINEAKALAKHISCECKHGFDVTKCNLNQWWNNIYVTKVIFGILLHVIVKIENIYKVLWMIQGLSVMKLRT